jgi:hypothetical protein
MPQDRITDVYARTLEPTMDEFIKLNGGAQCGAKKGRSKCTRPRDHGGWVHAELVIDDGVRLNAVWSK